MNKVSIITPVYKAEQYLSKCIESVLSQTYTGWELLLIDDGSPDNSGKICDEYVQKDSRIKVFHKQNGGVSSARNLGLEKATGEWILFLDADDCLYNKALENCLSTAKFENVDMVQFSLNRDVNLLGSHDGVKTPVVNIEEYAKICRFQVCAGGSFLRASIVSKENIRFDEKLKLAEDQLFMYQYMDKCQRIIRIDDVLYWYRENECGASRNQKTLDIIQSVNVLTAYKFSYPHWSTIIDKVNSIFLVDLVRNKDISLDKVAKLLKEAKTFDTSGQYGMCKLMSVISMYSEYLAVLVVRIRYFIS